MKNGDGIFRADVLYGVGIVPLFVTTKKRQAIQFADLQISRLRSIVDSRQAAKQLVFLRNGCDANNVRHLKSDCQGVRSVLVAIDEFVGTS